MKFFLLFCLLLIVSASCKKENNPEYGDNANKLSLQNSTIAASGTVVFLDNRNHGGVAKIYLRKDGVYILGIEGMSYIAPSSTSVYLSAVSGLNESSIKIYSSISFSDNLYFTLSSNINIAAFKYFVMQADINNSPTAIAILG